MNFNFDVVAKEVNGEDAQKTLAEILAEFLGTETKGNTVKLYYWYGCLQKTKSLDLDDVDKGTLTELITSTERLYVFLKGQLLEILNPPKTE